MGTQKHSLWHGRSRRLVLSFCLALAAGTASAQDTYWGLANEQVYNTETHAITTLPASGVDMLLEYTGPGAKELFDGAGNPLYTIANGGIYFNGYDLGYYNSYGQTMVIPGECRKYNVWYITYSVGHTVNLYVSRMDASMVTTNGNTSPSPQMGAGTRLNWCSDLYAGAVAAPLNPDGTRYLYFLANNGGMGGYWFQLYRHTFAADGTVNPTPVLVKDSLPADYVVPSSPTRVRMEISQDGKTIAYTKCNGKLVTYRMDGTGGAPTQYPDVALGIEQATTSTGQRLWYVSTGSALKFYVEGNTTATTISSIDGTKSELSLGVDGNVYFAGGDPLSENGDLHYTVPGNTVWYANVADDVVPATGSSIYVFGNHLTGDNTNRYAASSFGTPTISINGSSGTTTLDVLDCQPMTLVNTSNTISPYYRISIYSVPSNTRVDSTGLIYDTLNMPVDLRYLTTLNPQATNYLSNHLGLFDVKVEYRSICGGTTVTRRINVIAGPVASLGITGSYQTRANTNAGTPVVTTNFGPFTTAPDPVVPANPLTVGRNGTIFSVNSSVSSPGAYFCDMEVHVDQAVGSAWVNDVVPPMTYSASCVSWSPPQVPIGSILDANSDPFFVAANAPTGSIWRFRVGLSNVCGTLWRALPFKIGAKPTASTSGYIREAAAFEEENWVSFSPVPFGNKVAAQLLLAKEAKVSIRILGVDGRMIAHPVQEQLLPAGSQSLEMETASWPAGIYFYDCLINGEHHTGKLVKQ